MEERLDHLARIMERGFDTLADLLRGTNSRVDALNDRVDGLSDRVDGLTVEVKSLGARFDNFLTGAHHEDHCDLRQRVERIERRLGLGEAG